MIAEIQIKNFSIIESARVQFHQGFHVLSGETGAGKSILVQAVSFAVGARADTDAIRAGAEEASVTVAFDVGDASPVAAFCRELEINLEESEGQILLKRTLNASGKSRAYINDGAVTLKTLQALGSLLVHLVGQHASQRLMEEEYLTGLLDRYGKHESLLAAYRKSLSDYRACREELDQLKERVKASREKEDFIKYQWEELEAASLKEGEEAELESQRNRLKHRVTLATHAYEMNQSLLEGEDSISERLGRVLALAEKAAQLDESLKSIAESLTTALAPMEEAGRFLGDYVRNLEEDPQDFDRIETRLMKLRDLKRKYGLEEAGLVAKHAELKLALAELTDFDSVLEEKESAVKKTLGRLVKDTRALHDGREQAAKKISRKLEATLKDLALPHAKISWIVDAFPSPEEYKSYGGDRMRLMVSFNPGEELRPFEEIISGGELSRLLLAIYEILFSDSLLETFVFDEVDAGAGGGVAELIGRKLAALGQRAQVFCITHLPQIACQGQWHFSVEKAVRRGRTFSEIRLLNAAERVQEIARMLAGVEVTGRALEHAKELLKNYAA